VFGNKYYSKTADSMQMNRPANVRRCYKFGMRQRQLQQELMTAVKDD
jgi:Zn ribbon nucleic-acid-binding protein